ncbi:MAG: hypothetical protein R3E10_19330 [Gemmatimonadota bacterium]
MMRMSSRFGWACLIAVALAEGVEAQETLWRIPTTVGYGAVGFAAGASFAGWFTRDNHDVDETVEAALVLVAAGLGAGVIGGYRIGRSADRTLGDGRALSSGLKAAVGAGTVLSVGAVGALAAAIRISPPEPRGDWSDETTVVVYTGAGLAAGALLLWAVRDKLEPTSGPVVRLGPSADGLRVSVRWTR